MPTRHTPLRVAFRRPWPTTRRGLKLWLLALIIGMKGYGYATVDPSASSAAALELITQRFGIPLQACGWLIMAVCAFALVCSYCHYGRDRFGYMALAGFSAAWASAYAVTPLLLDGTDRAWQGALSYSLICLFIGFAAGDDDPQDHQ